MKTCTNCYQTKRNAEFTEHCGNQIHTYFMCRECREASGITPEESNRLIQGIARKLFIVAMLAFSLLTSLPTYAGPLDFLHVKDTLETGENILLFAAGAMSVCVVVWLFQLIARYWKQLLVVSAFLAALALLVMAL